uniref:Uncharacterized protein n=1 Tax=Cacopsylla melanoneura TaxID=428564 RepID=A0A8D8TDR3_9HEMI
MARRREKETLSTITRDDDELIGNGREEERDKPNTSYIILGETQVKQNRRGKCGEKYGEDGEREMLGRWIEGTMGKMERGNYGQDGEREMWGRWREGNMGKMKRGKLWGRWRGKCWEDG